MTHHTMNKANIRRVLEKGHLPTSLHNTLVLQLCHRPSMKHKHTLRWRERDHNESADRVDGWHKEQADELAALNEEHAKVLARIKVTVTKKEMTDLERKRRVLEKRKDRATKVLDALTTLSEAYRALNRACQ